MADLVIRLSGEFDISNALTIERTVARATEAHAVSRVVVDLSEVTFLDAAGIRALLRAQQSSARTGCQVVARNPSRLITEVLTVLGLTDRLMETTPAPKLVWEHPGRPGRSAHGDGGAAAAR